MSIALRTHDDLRPFPRRLENSESTGKDNSTVCQDRLLTLVKESRASKDDPSASDAAYRKYGLVLLVGMVAWTTGQLWIRVAEVAVGP